MRTRKITVIAASVGVAVAAATGVTYASSALESAAKSTSAVSDAAPAPAPRGGNGTGTNTGSNAASDAGHSDSWRQSKGNEGRGGNGGGNGGENRGEHRGDHRDDGRIMINERTYDADPGACIAVVNLNPPPPVGTPPIGATSFNIRNESDKTVEFFNGVNCDNGAPIATVGPRSSATAVTPAAPAPIPGVIVGSFRVIHEHNGNNGNNGHR